MTAQQMGVLEMLNPKLVFFLVYEHIGSLDLSFPCRKWSQSPKASLRSGQENAGRDGEEEHHAWVGGSGVRGFLGGRSCGGGAAGAELFISLIFQVSDIVPLWK